MTICLNPAASAPRILTVFAAWMVLTGAAFAIDPSRAMSQYVREYWGAERGFPHGSVYAITQAQDGYLWIGTDRGLLRFDGVQFRTMEELSGSDASGSGINEGVIGLVPDPGGDLWIRLMSMTLLRYHEGTIVNPLAGPGVKSPIFAMARGQHGEMLAAAGQQGVFTFAKDKLGSVANAAGMPRSPVLSVAETEDGSYWLGTRGAGLFRLKDGTTTQFLAGLPNPKVNCLLADGLRLWVGTDSGLVLWNDSGLAQWSAPAELKKHQILSLIKDRDTNLWLGTDTGEVFRLNSSGLMTLVPDKEEPRFAITALFEDREGSIWIGSAKGLERFRDSAFITYSVPEGVPSDGDNPVFVDNSGRMWFAPVGGGLWWWKDGVHGHVQDPGLDRDIVYSIAGAKDGLWLGRQHGGVTHLTITGATSSAQTWTVKEGLAQNSVYSVYQDREENVWAGTLSGGVSKWDGARFQTYTTAQGLASNSVTAILQAEREMWFASPRGLSRLMGGQWQTFRVADGLPSESVNCLFFDKEDTLWVGTDRGLAYRKNGRFHAVAGDSRFSRDQIMGVTEDRYGWLWVSTAHHVLRLNRKAVLKGNLVDGTVLEYGLADGLRGSEGVKRQYSVWADGRGRVWFSLNRGISMVDPARLRSNSEPGLPKLQSVTADGAELGTIGLLRVPASRQRLVFSYAGLSLSVPDRVQFRYRLDGFDRDWSKPLPDRQAAYTNLGPGPYRFRVMASNPDGMWSGTEAAIAFSVEAAYWQTWWFRLGVILLAAVTVALAHWLRLRQLAAGLSSRFEERLAERTRIAQDLHDTLLQGFISASMQLHVAAERIPAESGSKAPVLKILELMKRVTEEGRNAVRGLRGARSTAQSLEQAFCKIEEEVELNHSAELRVHSKGEGLPLHPVLRDEIYRIGREAILNAFRHANATRIEAELTYSANSLCLTVRDDGRGIEPQTLRSGKDGHWGLSGMRERSDRIGARLRVCSNPDAGTEVELTVPGNIAYRSRAKESA